MTDSHLIHHSLHFHHTLHFWVMNLGEFPIPDCKIFNCLKHFKHTKQNIDSDHTPHNGNRSKPLRKISEHAHRHNDSALAEILENNTYFPNTPYIYGNVCKILCIKK